MNYFAFTALVNTLMSVGLGVFVVARNPRNIVNRAFSLLCLSVALFSFCYFFWQISDAETEALFWSKGLMLASIFIPVCYFYFILAFLDKVKRYRFLLLGCYLLSLFFVLSDVKSLIVRGVTPKLYFPFWPEPGILYPFFLLMFFGLVIYSSWLLFVALRSSNGIRHRQISYVFIGFVVGFIGGATNYFLWYDIPFPPYANIFISVGFAFIAYAILKYRFMDIRIVFRKSLVILIMTVIFSLMILFAGLLASKVFAVGFNFNTAVIIALTFIIILLIINPLKRILNKLFLKQYYDLSKEIEGLTGDLEATNTLEKLSIKVSQKADKLFGVSDVWFLVYDKKIGKYISEFPKKGEIVFSPEDRIVTAFIEEKKPIIRGEIDYLVKESPDKKAVLEEGEKIMERLKWEAIFPLTLGGEIFGALALGEKRDNSLYSTENVEAIEKFCRQVTIALANVILYEDTMERVRREIDH